MQQSFRPVAIEARRRRAKLCLYGPWANLVDADVESWPPRSIPRSFHLLQEDADVLGRR